MKNISVKRVFILVLLCFTAMAAGLAADACFFAASRIRVTYHTVTDAEIPASLNGMQIACFGDLEYGTYMNKERLTAAVRQINDLSPDTVLFLGDLYDNGHIPGQTEQNTVIELLSAIKAPKGKFAVLGDFDEPIRDIVLANLYSAGFEVLEDSVIHLHNGSGEYISLVGFNSAEPMVRDLSGVYSLVQESDYIFAIAHNTAIVTSLPTGSTNLLAGAHAHVSQITIPLVGQFGEGSDTAFTPGLHTRGNTTVIVSRGLGTTGRDIRAFCDPEILLFRLNRE